MSETNKAKKLNQEEPQEELQEESVKQAWKEWLGENVIGIIVIVLVLAIVAIPWAVYAGRVLSGEADKNGAAEATPDSLLFMPSVESVDQGGMTEANVIAWTETVQTSMGLLNGRLLVVNTPNDGQALMGLTFVKIRRGELCDDEWYYYSDKPTIPVGPVEEAQDKMFYVLMPDEYREEEYRLYSFQYVYIGTQIYQVERSYDSVMLNYSEDRRDEAEEILSSEYWDAVHLSYDDDELTTAWDLDDGIIDLTQTEAKILNSTACPVCGGEHCECTDCSGENCCD